MTNLTNPSLLRTALIFIPFVLICVIPWPTAQAVSPAPDGGYPNGNTAEGQNALLHLTTGTFNTAIGLNSLESLTGGKFNTGLGAKTLLSNRADQNTAIGFSALFRNSTGFANTAIGAFDLVANSTGSFNTAAGVDALHSNTTGNSNTAFGVDALFSNTIGIANTAIGARAVFSNISGAENTAIGFRALQSNTTGNSNTAIGLDALVSNVGGTNNTANGVSALSTNTMGGGNVAIGTGALFSNDFGNTNTAVGESALANSLVSDNTALGADAGFFATTGTGNVYIGAQMTGVDGESNHTYIRNINSNPVSGTGTDTVTVNLTTGLLGHASSSRRYKEKVKPMDNASEALYQLHPVTFRYNKQIDRTQSPAFGLIAEEVAEVNPDLVARNSHGEPETVHYEMVNAMLLNEFLKEHRAFLEEQCKVERLEKQVAALTAGLQKVTAPLAMTNVAAGIRSDRDGPSREAGGSGSEQVNPSLADSR